MPEPIVCRDSDPLASRAADAEDASGPPPPAPLPAAKPPTYAVDVDEHVANLPWRSPVMSGAMWSNPSYTGRKEAPAAGPPIVSPAEFRSRDEVDAAIARHRAFLDAPRALAAQLRETHERYVALLLQVRDGAGSSNSAEQRAIEA